MFRKKHRSVYSTLGAVFLGLLSASTVASEIHQCGIEEHDDPQMRQQAATRMYWREGLPQSLTVNHLRVAKPGRSQKVKELSIQQMRN